MGYYKLKPIFRENSGIKTLLQNLQSHMPAYFYQRIILHFNHHGNEMSSLVVNVTLFRKKNKSSALT